MQFYIAQGLNLSDLHSAWAHRWPVAVSLLSNRNIKFVWRARCVLNVPELGVGIGFSPQTARRRAFANSDPKF